MTSDNSLAVLVAYKNGLKKFMPGHIAGLRDGRLLISNSTPLGVGMDAVVDWSEDVQLLHSVELVNVDSGDDDQEEWTPEPDATSEDVAP